jgi:hypothetical protein
MIASGQIEKFALQGKCIWRTFNTGYTSTATIPVPAGSFILLRQIIVYPFIPYFATTGSVSECVWQIVACEQGNNNELVYVIRNSRIPAGIGAASNDHPNSPHTIETWQTYRKNVIIDLSLLPNVARAVYGALDVLNVNADERDNKIGYGGVPVRPNVALDAFDNLYPTGEQRPFNATPYAGPAIIDRIRIKNQGAYQIPVPNQADGVHADFQFPLITFGYWEFKNATPESLV